MVWNITKLRVWASVGVATIGVVGGIGSPLWETTSWAVPEGISEEKSYEGAKSGDDPFREVILKPLPEDLIHSVLRYLSQETLLTSLKPTCGAIATALEDEKVRKNLWSEDRWSLWNRWTVLESKGDVKKTVDDFKTRIKLGTDRQFTLRFETPEEFIAFLTYPQAQKWVTGLWLQLDFRVTDVSVDVWKNLGKFKNLISLDFSGRHKLGPVGMKFLKPVLLELKDLKHLWLDGNRLGVMGAMHLTQVLPELQNLTYLNLQNNDFGAEGAMHLASGFLKSESLRSLELGGNNVGPVGTIHLAPVFPKMPALAYLDLQNNKLGANGAEHLASELPKSGSLTHLKLGDNNIGPVGMDHLAPAFPKMKNLEALSLINNQLSVEGAKRFTSKVEECKNLRALYLGGNALGNDGVDILIPALKTQRRLESLGLDYNQIELDTNRLHRMSAQWFPTSPDFKSLQEVNLKGNKVDRPRDLNSFVRFWKKKRPGLKVYVEKEREGG